VSDLGLDLDQETRRSHRGRRKHGNRLGCLAVLVALAVLAGGGYFVYDSAVSALQDRFDPPADYSGAGTGSVMVEVKEGQTASDIAQTLVAKDVVASAEAFSEAAAANPDSTGIQVGFYEMSKKMSAESALEVLLDPDNMIQDAVTLREGLNLDQIVEVLAKETDFSAKEFRAALRRPGSLGLPPYAGGNPEGYLFPATYQIAPDATPRSILRAMVDRFEQAAAELDLVARAEQLGLTPHELVTVASLVQAEARYDEDFPKVARVIYNRLEEPMPLQFDSTVHYAVGRDGSVGTSDEERAVDSPYNTYENPGLPPGPIMAPGEQALRAALEPADGPWLYFVTTNPDTGETAFTDSYDEHLQNKQEFDEWCASSANC
jgi:UPF0755 protein